VTATCIRRPSGPPSTFGPLLLCLLLTLAAGLSPATAQEPPPEAPSPAAPVGDELGDLAGPPDRYNRGTPRGSVSGFISACREGDYERATYHMDLRRLSPEEREQGPQLARQLKEVLDQKLWVDFATLSNRNEGHADDGLPAWQDRLGEIPTREGLITLLLQRVPREDDGVRIWKISADTVGQTAVLYAEFGPGVLETWLPPVFFEVHVLDLALWQWLGLLLLAVVPWFLSGLVAGTLIRSLGRLFTSKGKTLDERVVDLVRGPVRLAITALAFALGLRFLTLDIPVEQSLRVLARVFWVVSATWLAVRLLDFGAIALRARALRRGDQAQIPTLVALKRFVQGVVVVIGFLGVLSGFGVNITAALAGLGIGGVAVALAAQKTLENLFGAVELYSDEPVKVGDFFRTGDTVGTVEEIGLRSTRVRTLNRTVITYPNAQFSVMPLENYGKRDRIWLNPVIRLRYDTTPEQLRVLIARLREILAEHPRVADERVRFVEFGAYSLDLEVFAYVDTRDWAEFLEIREDLYLRFMDAVKEAGTALAIPASTTYLEKDGFPPRAGEPQER
jgi:MscS family membrane protein